MRKRVQAAGSFFVSACLARLDAELARRGSESSCPCQNEIPRPRAAFAPFSRSPGPRSRPVKRYNPCIYPPLPFILSKKIAVFLRICCIFPLDKRGILWDNRGEEGNLLPNRIPFAGLTEYAEHRGGLQAASVAPSVCLGNAQASRFESCLCRPSGQDCFSKQLCPFLFSLLKNNHTGGVNYETQQLDRL